MKVWVGSVVRCFIEATLECSEATGAIVQAFLAKMEALLNGRVCGWACLGSI